VSTCFIRVSTQLEPKRPIRLAVDARHDFHVDVISRWSELCPYVVDTQEGELSVDGEYAGLSRGIVFNTPALIACEVGTQRRRSTATTGAWPPPLARARTRLPAPAGAHLTAGMKYCHNGAWPSPTSQRISFEEPRRVQPTQPDPVTGRGAS
jgi:hypothetical protein